MHIGINEITDPVSFIITNSVLSVELNMETVLTIHCESNSDILVYLYFSVEK